MNAQTWYTIQGAEKNTAARIGNSIHMMRKLSIGLICLSVGGLTPR